MSSNSFISPEYSPNPFEDNRNDHPLLNNRHCSIDTLTQEIFERNFTQHSYQHEQLQSAHSNVEQASLPEAGALSIFQAGIDLSPITINFDPDELPPEQKQNKQLTSKKRGSDGLPNDCLRKVARFTEPLRKQRSSSDRRLRRIYRKTTLAFQRVMSQFSSLPL